MKDNQITYFGKQSFRAQQRMFHRPLTGVFAVLLTSLPFLLLASDNVLTEFTLDENNSSVEVMSVNITNMGTSNFRDIFDGTIDFDSGENDYDYVTQSFTPAESGTYTFGQTRAPVDTVMLVYEGEFNSDIPGDNLFSYNDDYGQQIESVSSFDPATVDDLGVTIVDCSDGDVLRPQRCPIIETSLEADQRYDIVISTFSTSATVSLPQSFFAVGPASVAVGQQPQSIPTIGLYGLVALSGIFGLIGALRFRRHAN